MQLYEQAQLALQYDDYDTARTALKKAAKMEPSNVEIVDALGALLAEIGPQNEAIAVSIILQIWGRRRARLQLQGREQQPARRTQPPARPRNAADNYMAALSVALASLF